MTLPSTASGSTWPWPLRASWPTPPAPTTPTGNPPRWPPKASSGWCANRWPTRAGGRACSPFDIGRASWPRGSATRLPKRPPSSCMTAWWQPPRPPLSSRIPMTRRRSTESCPSAAGTLRQRRIPHPAYPKEHEAMVKPTPQEEEAIAVRTAGLVNEARLGEWMDTQDLPGKGEPVTSTFISGGASNEIFETRRGDFRAVLRRPPRVVPKGRNETMMREYRVLHALNGTDVPHPEAYAACSDDEVMGSSFYLMSLVDGWSPMNMDGWPEPFGTDLNAHYKLT